MLPMPGLDGRFPKQEKMSLLFLMRPLIFSEAQGFSLPSRLVNPALGQLIGLKILAVSTKRVIFYELINQQIAERMR